MEAEFEVIIGQENGIQGGLVVERCCCCAGVVIQPGGGAGQRFKGPIISLDGGLLEAKVFWDCDQRCDGQVG